MYAFRYTLYMAKQPWIATTLDGGKQNRGVLMRLDRLEERGAQAGKGIEGVG